LGSSELTAELIGIIQRQEFIFGTSASALLRDFSLAAQFRLLAVTKDSTVKTGLKALDKLAPRHLLPALF